MISVATGQLSEPAWPPVTTPFPLHRFSVDQYQAMVRSGIFTKGDRFYVLNGLLVSRINLVDRQVEVYAGPHAGGYAPPVIYQPGSAVPVVIDGVTVGTIAVDDLLP